MPFKTPLRLAVLALALAPMSIAAPLTGSRRSYDGPSPKVTPTSVPSPPTLYSAKQYDAVVAGLQGRALDFELDTDLGARSLDENVVRGDTVLKRRSSIQKRATAACLGSNATDVDINSAFYYGGAGTIVSLCPGATITLSNSIFFTAPYQELITEGYPTDSTRAILLVTGDNSNAIYGPCDLCSNIALRNIAVNGQRDVLGYNAGIGLIELGGNTNGQIVDGCHIYEPRGWTCLHGIEGYLNSCLNMTVTNNDIGPCGHSPTNGNQFRERDTVTYPPGEWADGISMACKASLVQGNTVTDATDGAIVIFQAPGTLVTGNTIIAQTRVALGGINMVDYYPFTGSYEGTVVEGNTLFTDTTMIKIGIALGSMSWGSDNRTAARTSNGVVQNNVFKSGSTGYFGYGVSIAGHENATVLNNDATAANFGGDPSVSCIPDPMVPTSQAFVYDQWTTPGYYLQSNFFSYDLVFLICQEPGSIVASGPKAALGKTIISDRAVVASSSAVSSSAVSSSAVSSSAVSSSAVSSSAVPSSSSAPSSSSTITSSAVSSTITPVAQNGDASSSARDQSSLANAISLRRISALSVASVISVKNAEIASRRSSAKARAATMAGLKERAAEPSPTQAWKLYARGSYTVPDVYARVTPTAPAGMRNPFAILEEQKASASASARA
ncbi:hypothetical protein T439DRAFT_335932 [Meredithblackwellia eburnea MCA 4105]